MSRPPFRLPALALCALVVAGCGSAPDRTPATSGPPAREAKRGPITVAAVDGRVGDATIAGSAEGVADLPVGHRRTDPRVLRHGVGAGAACPDAELMPEAANLAQISAAALCLVNGERIDAGLPPLTHNDQLAQSSAAHSADMVANAYFAHEGRDGGDVVDRVRATGYIPSRADWTVGENLAWGTGTLATPKGIVQAWMNSQGHRENILRSSFREAGLGVSLGTPRASDGLGATYTMNFGAVGTSTTVSRAVSVPARTSTRRSRATRRAASERRASSRRRLRACRAKVRRARVSRVRRTRAARCARIARRARAARRSRR